MKDVAQQQQDGCAAERHQREARRDQVQRNSRAQGYEEHRNQEALRDRPQVVAQRNTFMGRAGHKQSDEKNGFGATQPEPLTQRGHGKHEERDVVNAPVARG